ncbi:hypothetical protein GW17_00057743 [Ensete ventricosum]|nr:hypothetical protein GW17_00057743 [Ensete ventricosum]
MVDRLQPWPPPPILLPPSTQELQDQIRGDSLQRSIVWIPLEKKTLDFFYPLYPNLEYRDMKCSEERGWPTMAKPSTKVAGHEVAQRSRHPGLAFRGMASPLRYRHHKDKQAKKNV